MLHLSKINIYCKNRGFTLIELLIVIAILGILASAVIVAINPGKRASQARDAQRKSDINAIANALIGYKTVTNFYPGENECDSSKGIAFNITGTSTPYPVLKVGEAPSGTSDDDGFSYEAFNFTDSSGPITQSGNSSGGSVDSYFRFTGVSGLSGKNIDSAILRIYFQTTSSDDNADAKIFVDMEGSGNPIIPTSYSNHELKTRSFAFALPPEDPSFVGWHDIDVTSLIQELVDTVNPTEIQFFFDDDGSPSDAYYSTWTNESYPVPILDEDPSAELNISYFSLVGFTDNQCTAPEPDPEQFDWEIGGPIEQNIVTDQEFLKRLPVDPKNNLEYYYLYEPGTVDGGPGAQCITGIGDCSYWIGAKLESPDDPTKEIFRCSDNADLFGGPAGCMEVAGTFGSTPQ